MKAPGKHFKGNNRIAGSTSGRFTLLVVAVLYLCSLPASVYAQKLSVVKENDRFTEYKLANPELNATVAFDIMVPQKNGRPAIELLDQKVVTRSINNRQIASLPGIPEPNASLFSFKNPGQHRGQTVYSAQLHIVRPVDELSNAATQSFLITKYVHFRVYKISSRNKRLPTTGFDQLTANSSSIFQTGEWYKIKFRKEGIYALDYEFLDELELDLENIPADQLTILSTPGYPLPKPNSEPRPELRKIPVIIEDGGDNRIDEGDRILFFGNSHHSISRTPSGTFAHELHPYSSDNCVFLTVGETEAPLMNRVNPNTTSQSTINEVTDFIWKEEERFKPEDDIKSGTEWFGAPYPVSTNAENRRARLTIFSDTIPGIVSNQELQIELRAISRSTRSAQFEFQVQDEFTDNLRVPAIGRYSSSTGYAARDGRLFWSPQVSLQNGILTVDSWYNYTDDESEAWLDWIRITFKRQLTAENNVLNFFAPIYDYDSGTYTYRLEGFEDEPYILSFTDPMEPVRHAVSTFGDVYEFNGPVNEDVRFISQVTPFTPLAAESVENQNLRGIQGFPEYIIISAEPFLEQAQELADYRQQRSGLESTIVTQQQVFNEFSGGVADPVATRDYLKFMYDRAGDDQDKMPKYVLLFGDTSFDYKNIDEQAPMRNFIFTYQSEESLNRVTSYGSDDFFVLLDDDEGEWNWNNTSERIDLGIGRLPVQTTAEAALMVEKIKRYESTSSFGNWRNLFSFAADDDVNGSDTDEDDLHVLNADGTAQVINRQQTGIRLNKIYQFSYPLEQTAAGRRVPQATEDFIQTINDGTLIMNYSGHGAEQVLSAERLFSSEFIPQFNNPDRPTIFVTATCSFGRFDDSEAQSGAEKMVLWDEGGAIAAFTTTRVVYTSSRPGGNNFGLNIELTRKMVGRDSDGLPRRFGDIYRLTKNTRWGAADNNRKFILLGDPAMRIGLPNQKLELDQINTTPLDGLDQDSLLTIEALQKVSISGTLKDQLSNTKIAVNGELNWTVYDAERYVSYPPFDWVPNDCSLPGCEYRVQNDILFQGRASIQNGEFDGTFIVPRDISFSDRNGRILMYATFNETDANGSFSSIRFQGIDTTAAEDQKGPEMDVYLNDFSFVNGNLVNSNPELIVDLQDESGINTTGNGVGHEIIARLNTNPPKNIVLNEYYTSELDNYREGQIQYKLDNLPEGDHELLVRAWDIHNNPSEQEIRFQVANSDQLRIDNAFNYPNPMNSETEFIFEHNQAGNPMDISVRIYTLTGRPVAEIQRSLVPGGSLVRIPWNGRDADQDRLANGTYLYVMDIKADTPAGRKSKQIREKLVILH